MTPARRGWRRFRRLSLLALACVLIAAAGLVAFGRLLLPVLVRDPVVVSTWLSERLGHEVSVARVEAEWAGAGPLLRLHDLGLAAPSGASAPLRLGKVELQIDLYGTVLPGRALLRDFALLDAELRLARDAQGRIRLEGIAGNPSADLQAWQWLDRIGEFSLRNGRLQLRDEGSGRSLSLDGVALRMAREQGDWRVGLALGSGAENGGRLRLVYAGALAEGLGARARLYAEADAFALAQLNGLWAFAGIEARHGTLDGQWWVDFDAGRVTRIEANGALTGVVLASAVPLELADSGVVDALQHLDAAAWRVKGAPESERFRLDLEWEREGGERGSLALGLARGEDAIALDGAGQGVPVALFAALAQLLPDSPAALRSRLYLAQPQGHLDQLEFWWRGPQRWNASASLRQLSVQPAGPRMPALAELQGRVSADPGGVLVELDGDPLEVAIPGVWKQPVRFLGVAGRIGVHRDAAQWRLEVPALDIAGEGYRLSARAELLPDPERGPRLDLSAKVLHGEVAAAKAFWVLNKMPPKTVEWLDRALIAGHIEDAGVVFRGHFSDWPFASEEGRFEAHFRVRDAVLDYHRDWPRAEAVEAAAGFINSSLRIDSASGLVRGNRIVATGGGIAVLKEPVLALDLAGSNDAARWFDFLRATPLERKYGSVFLGMALSGEVSAEAELRIPLKKTLGKTTLDGRAVLADVRFTDAKWDLDFTEVKGRAEFSTGGFAAEGLDLRAGEGSGQLRIAVGEYTGSSDRAVDAALRGRFSAQDLFGQIDDLRAILAQAQGSAPWEVDLSVDGGQSQDKHTHVEYRTSMEGIAIGFPAPLGKTASARRPLKLALDLPLEAGAPLRLDLGPEARLVAELPTRDRDFRGQLQFGPATPPLLPPRGLQVSGVAPGIDLAAWAGWIFQVASPASSSSILAGVDLRTDAGGNAEPEHFTLDRVDGSWVMRMEGPRADGELRFDGSAPGGGRVVAEFAHLRLPEPGDGVADVEFSPRLVPNLHLWVGDLSIGLAQLGQVRLEAFRVADGLRIEQLEARSPNVEVRASGDWLEQGGRARSKLNIRMSAQDLGRMLSGLGFAGVVEGGQTLATIDASWPGAPTSFALERLSGTLEVSVGGGRFLDVEPGAGRIFGLLSVRELPRRLLLDFRDFFQTGMSFDRIDGRFAMADGNAWTDDLVIRGPAADILVIGRTGLASRDYDQQVMVAPRISGALPLVGGLAAGPLGAAAGLLAQGVAGAEQDIEKSSSVHYSIAGSWEKPVVARLMPVRPDARPRNLPPQPAG